MQTDHQPHYFLPTWIRPSDETLDADVCIYGGTAAGVIAARTAQAAGNSVVLVNPARMLGGMTTNGLGCTDFGNKSAVGGRALRFYKDVGREYGREEEWQFEPSVAQRVISSYAASLDVRSCEFLAAVAMDGRDIASVQMLSGLRVRARQYIDCTYEGDLMAMAGVSFAVGRESNDCFGESINGAQLHKKHQFSAPVDPWRQEGRPDSGALPGIDLQDAPPNGSGDTRIQSYNFRMCLTDDPALRVPFAMPDGYDRIDHELAARWLNAEPDRYNDPLYKGELRKFDRLCVAHKTDTNNHGAVSSDFIGGNYGWPDGSYAQRERIFQQHRQYQAGLYYFLANDSAVPARYREAYSRWGLASDEFGDTGHWPEQLYVREARRLRGDTTLTEADVRRQRTCDDPIALGAYAMDSHNCRRIIRDGVVKNEGDVQVQLDGRYAVSYRSIVPRRGECQNLLVPVCCSASHIAFGSIRMEPAFMCLAESAALAAVLSIRAGLPVQELPYAKLRPALDEAGQHVESS